MSRARRLISAGEPAPPPERTRRRRSGAPRAQYGGHGPGLVFLVVARVGSAATTVDDHLGLLVGGRLEGTGLKSVWGSSPAARGLQGLGPADSPPSTVTAELSAMFCGLKALTRRPGAAECGTGGHRVDLPASEVVPWTIRDLQGMGGPGRNDGGGLSPSGRRPEPAGHRNYGRSASLQPVGDAGSDHAEADAFEGIRPAVEERRVIDRNCSSPL